MPATRNNGGSDGARGPPGPTWFQSLAPWNAPCSRATNVAAKAATKVPAGGDSPLLAGPVVPHRR
jgi:hypothetical protein